VYYGDDEARSLYLISMDRISEGKTFHFWLKQHRYHIKESGGQYFCSGSLFSTSAVESTWRTYNSSSVFLLPSTDACMGILLNGLK
jgi:hypothetical protein